MSKSFLRLGILFCSFLMFSTIFSFPVANAEVKTTKNEAKQIESEIEDYEALSPLLELVEKMPDAVANSGIDSGVEWLNENKGSEFAGYTFIADGYNLTTVADNLNGSLRGVSWDCISSAGKAIAVNALPWAKILKVKQAAKLMGGINSMTKTIVTAYKHQRNLGYGRGNAIKRAVSVSTRALPGETQKAVLEFFELGDVIKNCF
ncbi:MULTISPECIES: hypothetical protein [Bacillus cereus group]|uniref:hypothetical protein n=1 Tax=Bacillus cereus group TaxID=86661 RepID=UPI000976AA8C|nr:hypothetical protein [Bacillus cereus]ONG94994.1 hypothetical protein BKK45_26485 [Bacillus cereus]